MPTFSVRRPACAREVVGRPTLQGDLDRFHQNSTRSEKFSSQWHRFLAHLREPDPALVDLIYRAGEPLGLHAPCTLERDDEVTLQAHCSIAEIPARDDRSQVGEHV
jgi:hypothetical protein